MIEDSRQNCEGDICKIRPETDAAENDAHESVANDTTKSCTGNDTDPSTANEGNSSQPLSKANRREKKKDTLLSKSSSIITTLHGQQDLDTFVSTNNAVIIEFMTTWCGACKSIEEYYNELSMSHQDFVRSAKVMCDKNKQTKKLAADYHVKSYPVFIVFKDGDVSNRWDGADKGKLESSFERLMGSGPGSRGKKKKGSGRSKRR